MKRISLSYLLLYVGTSLFAAGPGATSRLTLTGQVTDETGRPLEDSTVMVYKAGVKHGYSNVCPTCYTDCGKRALTGSDGRFRIPGLSPDLKFELLVVHEGYVPTSVKDVDPANERPGAILKRRNADANPSHVVSGIVIDGHARPVRDAVVQPQRISPLDRPGSSYGMVPGLEPIAVTNEKGEFELAYTKPLKAMAVLVEGRGMAPKIATNLASGSERHTITLTDGATIRGRLVQNGKPVPGAEIGLVARKRAWAANLKMLGYPLPEIRIGTNKDGTFAITNVPPGVDWYIYGKMESLTHRGGTPILECATNGDGEEINSGDLAVIPALRLRGKVVRSDGRRIPEGTRIMITRDEVPDWQMASLAEDGSFEFTDLTSGDYVISASAKGYGRGVGLVMIDNDINHYVLTIEPQ